MGMVVHYQSLRANRSLRFVRQLRLAHFLFGKKNLVCLIKCKIKFLIRIGEMCYDRRKCFYCSVWIFWFVFVANCTLKGGDVKWLQK